MSSIQESAQSATTSEQPDRDKLHLDPKAQNPLLEAANVKLRPKIKPQQLGLKVAFQPNETEDTKFE